MKIKYIIKKKFVVDTDEKTEAGAFCCSKLENAVEKKSIKFMDSTVIAKLYHIDRNNDCFDAGSYDHIEIEYCPFCGEKFSIKKDIEVDEK